MESTIHMPLKSLELVGYKTFASKTKFEFSDSVTAIVGPNGSGKSNIADSLRWVLGEQAYSLLRGKKTVDMIFSGSEQRPRAGMASATVTFDNDDGWLPIDFSEVAITRRAYRDGQNEYLINNQRVRLRDVSELLGRSGLAERTYTIIGQGLVDAALSLKAEERRKLFEEAAGIGVFRARREEALRRLGTTRRNLERVRDILAELKPRLRSLDRQARRAEEYDQIKTDLHVLLREWYGYHWHRQQKELTAAREAAQHREAELLKARSRQTDFDGQIRTLRVRIHMLRDKLNGWQRELGDLHNRRERVSRELAVAGERQRALAERGSDIRTERTRLREEIRLRQERLERAAGETERLRRRTNEAREAEAEAAGRLLASQEAASGLSSSVMEAEKDIARHTARIAAGTARLDELKKRVEFLRAAQSEIENSLDTLNGEIGKTELQRDQARRALESINKQRLEFDRQLSEAGDSLDSNLRQLDEVLQERNIEEAELARLEARLEVLKQAESALAGYSQGARLLLKARDAGDIDPGVSSLNDHLQVRPEHEPAVAAALGGYLDAVVLPSESEMDQALDLLLDGQAGGALLALERISDSGSIRPPDHSGVLGALAGFVHGPDAIRPVINLLLGRFILVEDRLTATLLEADLPPGASIVTLRGEVFEPGGAVLTAGQGSSPLLSRSRRLKETRAQIETVRSRLAGLEEGIQAKRGRVEEARSLKDELSRRLGEARAEEREAETALREAEGRVDSEQTRIRFLESQLGGQRNEHRLALGALAETDRALDDDRRTLSSSRAALEKLQQENGQDSIEELRAQVAHWKTQIAVADRAAEDAAARADDLAQAVDEVRARLEVMLRQLESADREQARLVEEQAKLAAEEAETVAQITEARGRIDPAESELHEIEKQQDAIQEKESEARLALTTAERNHAQAQITLARRQEALDSLRQRIEDDFGLVAFEYVEDISGPNPLPLGNLVESLPLVDEVAPELGATIKRQRAQLRRIGAINPDARREHAEVRQRFDFMTSQVEDLEAAEADILETVSELDVLMEREFRKTFDEVAGEFRSIFTRLFGGGSARLVLTQPDDLTATGVDIDAQLPGRRTQGLSLLSGGERSLTASALVFSLIKVSPTPFCVLDEVDAMLDEANVNRFADLLRELSDRTQFIVITHNRNTVQAAETIYGITMGRDSTSQVLGLKMDEVAELV